MKFKGIYQGKRPDLALGLFFNTDIRKLTALRYKQKGLFSDEMGEPERYLTKRVQADDSLYACMKERSKVIGYVALDPLKSGVAMIHWWFKDPSFELPLVRDAMQLGVGLAFKVLELRRLSVTIPVGANGLGELLGKVGFVKEGVLRKLSTYDGELKDVEIYGMLQEEF